MKDKQQKKNKGKKEQQGRTVSLENKVLIIKRQCEKNRK